MLIAFTHNVKLNNTEAEAEFDTPETISAIADGVVSLGHTIELVEVSGPPSKTIARLETLNPDLIFNTAEGRFGKYREGFYPGIFEQLGIPFTGSDAYVCSQTLDKNITKMIVAQAGVPVARSLFVRSVKDFVHRALKFPVILKPNFEGSSKGITIDSIVESENELKERLPSVLRKYPSGILIEEYIEGKDITVPFIEGLSPKTFGVLAPIEYVFDPSIASERKYQIYDYELKNKLADKVTVKVCDDLSARISKKIITYSRKVYETLGVRDFGRIDFRLTPDNEIYFIEINALPSLEPGAGIYVSAEYSGLTEVKDVLGAIIKSAARRYNIKSKKILKRKRYLRVGFTFNQKRIIPNANPDTDVEAEYDAPKTLNSIRDAIASYGHKVIDLEATTDLPSVLTTADVDVVFNIAEGIKGRNRETQVPAILELLDIPYTGSDPATLSLTLDKALAKKVVSAAGIRTPSFFQLSTGKEKLPSKLKFPLIVKPVAEGSSKGVFQTSVVENEKELKSLAQEIIQKYRQPALVEEFLPGREFTVALVGENRPKVFPPMEIVFSSKKGKWPVYTYQDKLDYNDAVHYQAPADIDDNLRKAIEKVAKKSFYILGCRDVARIDVRLDTKGNVHFIECNPLPGLTPGWSDLCLIAESVHMDYRTLIGEILAPAIRRYKERQKLLMNAPINGSSR